MSKKPVKFLGRIGTSRIYNALQQKLESNNLNASDKQRLEEIEKHYAILKDYSDYYNYLDTLDTYLPVSDADVKRCQDIFLKYYNQDMILITDDTIQHNLPTRKIPSRLNPLVTLCNLHWIVTKEDMMDDLKECTEAEYKRKTKWIQNMNSKYFYNMDNFDRGNYPKVNYYCNLRTEDLKRIVLDLVKQLEDMESRTNNEYEYPITQEL